MNQPHPLPPADVMHGQFEQLAQCRRCVQLVRPFGFQSERSQPFRFAENPERRSLLLRGLSLNQFHRRLPVGFQRPAFFTDDQ